MLGCVSSAWKQIKKCKCRKLFLFIFFLRGADKKSANGGSCFFLFFLFLMKAANTYMFNFPLNIISPLLLKTKSMKKERSHFNGASKKQVISWTIHLQIVLKLFSDWNLILKMNLFGKLIHNIRWRKVLHWKCYSC